MYRRFPERTFRLIEIDTQNSIHEDDLFKYHRLRKHHTLAYLALAFAIIRRANILTGSLRRNLIVPPLRFTGASVPFRHQCPCLEAEIEGARDGDCKKWKGGGATTQRRRLIGGQRTLTRCRVLRLDRGVTNGWVLLPKNCCE